MASAWPELPSVKSAEKSAGVRDGVEALASGITETFLAGFQLWTARSLGVIVAAKLSVRAGLRESGTSQCDSTRPWPRPAAVGTQIVRPTATSRHARSLNGSSNGRIRT